MTDEVRTALAVIVQRGLNDDLVAKAAAEIGAELGRLRAYERNCYFVLAEPDTFSGHQAANFILTGGGG